MSAQDLDPVDRWAAVAGYDIRVFPDGEKEPLAGPGLVYARAGGVDLKLDVFTAGPETVTRPTVIYIHGGGWVHLKKEDRMFYGLPYLARGMNVVNVEYRMANVAPAPAAVEDLRCSVHWVYAHAKEYGFDVNKLVTVGESAGGHLALMAGMLNPSDGLDDTCAWYLKSTQSKVAAIVDYFGPVDLAAMLQAHVVQPYLLEWLPRPNRMELAKRMSPINYVRKGGPPTIIIHGTKDAGVPYAGSVQLHAALDAAGVPNELVSVPNGGHGQRSWPREENIRVQAAIFKFLEKQGIIGPPNRW